MKSKRVSTSKYKHYWFEQHTLPTTLLDHINPTFEAVFVQGDTSPHNSHQNIVEERLERRNIGAIISQKRRKGIRPGQDERKDLTNEDISDKDINLAPKRTYPATKTIQNWRVLI